MSVLNQAHFHDETAAFEKLESLIWPHGPVCPHCGGKERIYKLQGVRTKPSKKNPKGVERPGLKKCGHCRKQFTVRVGTVFESSHIPTAQMVSGCPPALLFQEGHQQPPAPPRPRGHL